MPPRTGKAKDVDKVEQQPAVEAVENKSDSVDNGGEAGENGGTDQGTEAVAGTEAVITGDGTGEALPAAEEPGAEEQAPAAGEDHETAFDRRLARLTAIAEEADFESGTIVGDIRDLFLDTAKAQPKGWGHMSEGERREFAKASEQVAKVILRKIVQIVAEEDEISVHATLNGYKVNGDAFVLTAKAKGDEDTAVQLFRLDGHEVVIISADSTRFHGQRRDPAIPPDRPELPFSDPPPEAVDEIRTPPPGSEDLAEAGAEVAAEREGAELSPPMRVNLKTSMIQQLKPEGERSEKDPNVPWAEEDWEDVRAATPEELAAEREQLAAEFDAGDEELAGN